MLAKLISALHNANLDMTAEEIADTLWLALQMDSQQEEVDLPQGTASPIHEDLPSGQHPLSPLPTPSAVETSAKVHLDARHSHDKNASHVGVPFRSPAASALPKALVLARALRPLMRRIPSKTAVVFNEHATVQRLAETRMSLWTPVFDPAPVRWFDIELIVDVGASMLLWKETIAELRTLLEHLGAFRNVRLWRLATDNKDRVDVYAGKSSAQEQAQAHDPKELINPSGYRLMLVVSDCISPAWHSGKVQELLDVWGQKNLVTLLHMLPRRLWPQTTLENADIVQIYSSQPDVSNRRLKTRKSLKWVDDNIPAEHSLPLPVVTLEANSLSSWARVLTTSTKKTWVTGAIFAQSSTDLLLEEKFSSEQAGNLSPKKRVQLFQSSASSLARKLAGLLAATPIPISLPVIRQVQSTMLQDASQVHVAEVFLGGLLEEIYQDETQHDPDRVQYDFIAGVRDELINTVPIPDAHRVLREISQFVRDHYGQPRDFLAFIAAPQGTPNQSTSITKDSRPFAQIELSALRRFGGTFVSLVDEIEHHIQLVNEQQDELYGEDNLHQTILEAPQEYPSVTANPTSPNPSFMSETWCDFAWTAWLPLNSPELPTGPGIYRVRAVKGDEIFYIGSTGRNLKERIGDLHRNIMRDATQMPFNDPHTAAPSLWAWRDATGIDFECSATLVTSDEMLDILVNYLLWQYRLERGSSTLANHGRFHPHYTKSKDRKTGVRGQHLLEGQSNPNGGPSFPPLPPIATPPEQTWMGLTWSEYYPLRSASLQNIVSSPGAYKILDLNHDQLLETGTSINLRSRFQDQARKRWECSDPMFCFAALPPDILPHQLNEVENDLIAGYYAQTKTTSSFQPKNLSDDTEETQSDEGSIPSTSP